jgi:acetyltransferase-like isoleucine patch superfamily enzyme
MRGFLKGALIGMALIPVFPLWILYRLESLMLGTDKAFYGWSQLMSLFPGLPGNYLRFAFYKLSLAELGKDACICFGATLAHPGIRIGKGAYIGPHCNLGLCLIEEDALLGTGVHVMSGLGQHGSADLDTPIRDQKGALRQVRVGADAWVGNQAVIGADVGRKCIIGAAAVVVKPLPEFAIAAGNPARIIRMRTPNEALVTGSQALEEPGDDGA